MTTRVPLSTKAWRHHNHQQCVTRAMHVAQKICEEKGARFTPLRKRVLELIWSSHKPVKAYELLDQLSDDTRLIKPPTVYRSLEFLEALGLIHRVESVNGYLGCSHANVPHSAQFFICSDCGAVEEFNLDTIVSALQQEAQRVRFRVSKQTIELFGQCATCHNS